MARSLQQDGARLEVANLTEKLKFERIRSKRSLFYDCREKPDSATVPSESQELIMISRITSALKGAARKRKEATKLESIRLPFLSLFCSSLQFDCWPIDLQVSSNNKPYSRNSFLTPLQPNFRLTSKLTDPLWPSFEFEITELIVTAFVDQCPAPSSHLLRPLESATLLTVPTHLSFRSFVRVMPLVHL